MVYNTRTKTMMESINVVIEDSHEETKEVEDKDDVSLQQTDVAANVPPKESDI